MTGFGLRASGFKSLATYRQYTNISLFSAEARGPRPEAR
jgi:hypothetical protein